MTLFFAFKLLIVAFFLVMFLRGARLPWGVGLLTVTTAFLLDTFLGTFGREAMIDQLGFFFYIISGALFAGAAFWLWGILRPAAGAAATAPVTVARMVPYDQPAGTPTRAARPNSGTAVDLQMLHQQIHDRLGPDDILDLIFDLGLNENEVLSPNQDIHQLILRLLDLAEQRGQMSALALAVERILTPLPPENLPRPEKITVDSPPTVLRQYLLAHYSEAELQTLASDLGVDWEQLDHRHKKALARGLLLYLYRRNRLDELVRWLQPTPAEAPGRESDNETQS